MTAVWSRGASAGVVLLVCSMLYGCASSQVSGSMDLTSVGARNTPVFVLEAPLLSSDASSTETYFRARQVVHGLASRGVAVVAPWEIQVEEGESWPRGSNALARLLADNGLSPESVVRLRLHVEEAAQFSDITRSAAGGGGQAQIYRNDVRVHLIALSFGGSREMGRFTSRFSEDPGALGRDVREPRPQLAEAIGEVVARFADETRTAFPAGTLGRASGIRGLENGARLFRFGGGYNPPLETQWQSLGSTDRKLQMLTWYRRLHGQMDVELMETFDALPEGVLVTDPGGLASRYGLLPGDYVVRVNRRPAWTHSTIERAFLSTPIAQPVRLEVMRGSEIVTLVVPRQ